MPSAGRLTKLTLPKEEVRIDYGYQEGNNVSIYYDPMIAKIISKGVDRKTAINSMLAALEKIDVRGVDTNLNFLMDIYNNQSFIKGEIDTNFIDNFYKGGYKGTVKNEFERFYIGLMAFLYKIN